MNIQQIIIEGLRSQLYRHQYIVLPGFGGFVLKPRAAHFSPSGLQLHPPAKTVSFNSQLKQNDGILSAWLQKKINCTPETAYSHLGDFASYCRGVLENRRRLTLPGIGFFHLDFENNICFEPVADHNFLPESFGLSPINLSETAIPEKPVRKRAVFEDRLITSTDLVKTGRKKTKELVLPLLLVGVIGLLTLLLVSVSHFRGELRAALTGSGTEDCYIPVFYEPLNLEKPQPMAPLQSDANGIARLRIGETDLAVNVLNSNQGTENNKTYSERGAYRIVLGCFSVPENADKMLRQLKTRGIEAGIAEKKHKGMVVVTYGHYPDKAAAVMQLEPVKKVIPQAWVKEF